MRPLRVAAALALASAALAVPQAAAATGTYVYLLDRVANVRTMEFTVVASGTGNDSVLLVLGTRRRAPRREPTFHTYTALSADALPRVYATGVPCPCVPTPLDQGSVQFAFEVDLEEPGAPDRWYVAIRGEKPEIRLGRGVGLRELPGTYFRFVNGNDTATGVQYGYRHWEDFRGASARGGRWGSYAWAAIPCDDGGTGDVTLAGGRAPVRMGCPEPALPFGWQWADRETTWRLEGRATGHTFFRHRLLVLDMPRL